MTYKEALQAATQCTSYEQSDSLLKSIECNDQISDRQYYSIRSIAIDSAYAAILKEEV